MIRCLEFFAGIGGFATAAARVWSAETLEVLALDIDQDARRVYALNHAHRYLTCEIQSLDPQILKSFSADLWWLSPPCQPYTRRGQGRDIDDPRSQSLLCLIEQIRMLRPKHVALENVAAFANSRAFELLNRTLSESGYALLHRVICPTDMGWPNRRPRFYLLASQDHLPAWHALPQYHTTVADLISGAHVDHSACAVEEDLIRKFLAGMNRVDPACESSITACFGSSYGKSLLHAGSYCLSQATYRRFSPEEVARLLGFPPNYHLPAELNARRLWKLFGNSLSIPVVEYVLRHLKA